MDEITKTVRDQRESAIFVVPERAIAALEARLRTFLEDADAAIEGP